MILAILQARASSSRFPGKVLAPLHGSPMIARQLERIEQSKKIDKLVVATSIEPSDDKLAETVETMGITVIRGPLDDVLARFELAISECEPSSVVRLTADCPLTDPEVIDRVIDLHLRSHADYTSNVVSPTYPDGLDVEVFTKEAFARLTQLKLTGEEREHVTLGICRRPQSFSIESVTSGLDLGDLRWTVDVPADLEFVERVYANLYDKNPQFRTVDVLNLLSSNKIAGRTAAHLERNAGLNQLGA